MWSANLPGVKRGTAILLPVLLLAAACARSTPAALVEYRDGSSGFVVRYPQGWTPVADRGRSATWFVPSNRTTTPGESPEFIVVFTVPAGEKLSEPEIRRQVFTRLPVQGVSGFQRDGRTTAETLWYKFEVTGSTEGTEWASVGVVASGPARFHVAVCAKPLPQWREGQKQCDEVIRTFQPGGLEK